MKNFVKFSLLAIVAVSASVASAADLEFHGYSRVGLGLSARGGSQSCFMQSVNGISKFRLGNECDWVLEPSFEMKFTKLDDKSEWGVHMLPAMYRRFDDDRSAFSAAVEDLPMAFKEYYFFGNNVPQLGGGQIWAGRRYFGRMYLGAINDQFIEAQDGTGFGVYDIPVGPAKLNFDLTLNPFSGGGAAAASKDLSVGAHVTNIPTFNKDSNLQIWARVYTNSHVQGGTKYKTGFSASFMHVAGFGSAGNLTVAGRFDQNAATDQQDSGARGARNLELALVYGVNIPSARTSVDAMFEFRQQKAVAGVQGGSDDKYVTNFWMAGFRTDTQLSGPFRFLLEAGYDWNKYSQGGSKAANLFKITPCFAISGGNDPWSRPTFRFFYTYASWNKDGAGQVTGAWKDSATGVIYAGKTSGSSFGIQAEGWW